MIPKLRRGLSPPPSSREQLRWLHPHETPRHGAEPPVISSALSGKRCCPARTLTSFDPLGLGMKKTASPTSSHKLLSGMCIIKSELIIHVYDGLPKSSFRIVCS
ncbi:hypothetical protein DsansV1_C18g0154741 [Dioscorea sansibarensis]